MTALSDWLIQNLFADRIIAHMLLALLLGTIIGMEREWRQRSAGLRTNALVALGAASFVDLAHSVAANSSGVTQVIAYIVSGVGFLGAGAIMKEGANIRGLNTAATIWCSAAVGASSAAGNVRLAILTTTGVVFLNGMIRSLLQIKDRITAAPAVSGAVARTPHVVRIVCLRDQGPRLRTRLLADLKDSGLRTVGVTTGRDGLGADHVAVVADLIGPAEQAGVVLERIVSGIETDPAVMDSGWRVGAPEGGDR